MASQVSKNLTPGIDHTGVSVVYFCHDGSGNVLMAKRSQNARDEKGCWDIGGGGINFNTNVEVTLYNEIKEEYCTEVLDYDFLGYRSVHRISPDGSPTHWITLDFKVLVDRGLVAIGEPHKFDDLGWFTLDTLPNPTHSQLPIFLGKYKNSF